MQDRQPKKIEKIHLKNEKNELNTLVKLYNGCKSRLFKQTWALINCEKRTGYIDEMSEYGCSPEYSEKRKTEEECEGYRIKLQSYLSKNR